MIEKTIHFIISLLEIFVKFLSSIEINLFGFSFSFYTFALCSILILILTSGLISISKRVGGKIIGSPRDRSYERRTVSSKYPTAGPDGFINNP